MPRPLHAGNEEQRQVEHKDDDQGRHQVVEQLEGLVGVGGDKVEKHAHAYHARAVEVDEHHLEGCKKYQWKQYPHLPPCFARERHEQGVEAGWQEHVGHGGGQWHALGNRQGDVGHQQHDDGVEKQELWRECES